MNGRNAEKLSWRENSLNTSKNKDKEDKQKKQALTRKQANKQVRKRVDKRKARNQNDFWALTSLYQSMMFITLNVLHVFYGLLWYKRTKYLHIDLKKKRIYRYYYDHFRESIETTLWVLSSEEWFALMKNSFKMLTESFVLCAELENSKLSI